MIASHCTILPIIALPQAHFIVPEICHLTLGRLPLSSNRALSIIKETQMAAPKLSPIPKHLNIEIAIQKLIRFHPITNTRKRRPPNPPRQPRIWI